MGHIPCYRGHGLEWVQQGVSPLRHSVLWGIIYKSQHGIRHALHPRRNTGIESRAALVRLSCPSNGFSNVGEPLGQRPASPRHRDALEPRMSRLYKGGRHESSETEQGGGRMNSIIA